ncbi:hypothetical protein Hanom_Chr10g00953741 [Helianthus anomalus]
MLSTAKAALNAHRPLTCLVQGVYILERDRQENRQASEALAPPWWKWNFFQFDLLPVNSKHPPSQHTPS